MSLTATIDEGRDIPVVQVQGDIDVTSAPGVREALDTVIAGGATRVVVDLTAVTFIDSTGLGLLIGRVKALRRSGGGLAIAATHERVLRVLSITGLDTVLPIEPDVEQASAALTS